MHILIFAFILAGLPAVLGMVMMLFPEPVARARENLENHPWRSLFLGLLTFVAVALVEIALISIATTVGRLMEEPVFLAFLGLILIVALGMPLLIGLDGAIQLVSHRLGELNRPLSTYLRGGGMLLLTCMIPLVGWFLFTPLVVWASIGSVVALLRRQKGESTNHPSTASTVSISGKN